MCLISGIEEGDRCEGQVLKRERGRGRGRERQGRRKGERKTLERELFLACEGKYEGRDALPVTLSYK